VVVEYIVIERKQMHRLALLVNNFIHLLLRDASIRVGLLSVKTKPTEWVTLMGGTGTDGADRAQSIKMVAYVVHHLLNANKLMNFFSLITLSRECKCHFPNQLLLYMGMGGKSLLLIFLGRNFVPSSLTLLIFPDSGTR